MVAFIKNNELYTIRKKLIILYILNVTDIIFTLALLKTGYFRETNILMANVVNDPFLSFIFKIIFPIGLLFWLYKRICLADSKLLHVVNIGILVSLALYTLVNISHLVWVALLPMLMYYT